MRGMSLIVRTITKLIIGFIFAWGIYIVINGHITPGGGFAGGVVIAGAFVLYLLAFGIEEAKMGIQKWYASVFESTGILIFLSLAMVGLFCGTAFFINFISKVNPGKAMSIFSAGIIPLCNIAIGIEVAAALFSIVIALVALGKEKKGS